MTNGDTYTSVSRDTQRIRARIYEAYHSTTSAHASTHMAVSRLLAQCERQFARYLPRDCSGPALDIGCGSGEFVLFLQRRGYNAAEGIDVSLEQIALAQTHGVKNMQQGNIFSYLGARVNHYPLITAFNMLEHLQREEMFHLMDLAKTI